MILLTKSCASVTNPYQLILLIEVGPMDKFLMIVVKQNVIVFGSMQTLNAVDSRAWNWQKKPDVQLFSKTVQRKSAQYGL